MRATIVLMLAMIWVSQAWAGCGGQNNDKPVSEPLWGAPVNGLSTRVSLLEAAPAVGQPLKVKLEVKNVDQVPRTFDDQQAAVNDSMIVKGPDGKEVAHIGGSFQTMGLKTTLPPGAIKIVVKELDVASQYLLDKDGKHTLQFRARGGLPASNELSITLKAGELPDLMKLLASIQRAAPAGWRTAKYGDTIVMLNTPTNLKADATSITLYFSKKGGDSMREGRMAPVYLGMTSMGQAAIVLGPNAAERWPEHRKFLDEQLKPFLKAN